MSRQASTFLPAFVAFVSLLLAAGPSRALPQYGDAVDAYCTSTGGTPATPYAGNCAICHNPASSGRDRTEGFSRFRQNDLAYFCPVAQANQAPSLDRIGDRTVSENAMLAFQVTASDPDGDALALEASGLPTGAVFVDNRNGTGDFAWMPGFDQAGNHSVTFRVTDAGSPPASGSETITISVGNVNRPPTLETIGNRSGVPGELLAFDARATDPDGDALLFSTAGMPATAEFVDHGDGTASFGWTPTDADTGNLSLTISVTDDGVPMQGDSEVVAVSVGLGQNRPPVLDPIGDRTLAPDEMLQILLTASDPDGDSLSFACDGLPGGAELVDQRDGSAELLWQPGADQVGNFPLDCSVVDTANALDSESFMVTVGSVNRPPVLAPVTLMQDGATYVMPLTASDPDGDALQLTAQGAPVGSDLADYGDGTGELSYTPQAGESGTFDIRFMVTDDGTPPESDARDFSLVFGEPTVAELEIRRALWRSHRDMLLVSGSGAEPGAQVELDAGGSALATTTADRRGRFQFRLRMSEALVPCAIEVVSGASGSGVVDLAGAPSGCGGGGELLPQSPGATGSTWTEPDDGSGESEEAAEIEDELEEDAAGAGSWQSRAFRSWLGQSTRGDDR